MPSARTVKTDMKSIGTRHTVANKAYAMGMAQIYVHYKIAQGLVKQRTSLPSQKFDLYEIKKSFDQILTQFCKKLRCINELI